MTIEITLSVDDEVLSAAGQRAETLGTNVHQLVCEYLEQLAGKRDPGADADEFMRLAINADGNSRGWEFNREEIHQRR